MKETPYLEKREDIYKRFKQLPFLKSLDDEVLDELVILSKLQRYEAGELIIPEGVYDSWIYILISGTVSVVKNTKVITSFSDPGEMFGEVAVIDGSTRSASLVAATETTCLATDASFMDRVGEESRQATYSVLYRMFAEVLSKKLRRTDEELVRVRKELDKLKEEMGRLYEMSQNGDRFRLKPTTVDN